MKKTLLKTFFLTCFILFTNSIFSQSNNWEEYYSDNKIKIEYNYMICDFSSTASQELIVFRFSNLSGKEIALKYETKIWYNNKEINTEQNSEEFRKTIRLESNEIITINCHNEWKEFTIFSAFIHNETSERYATLTQFELTNITTTHE